MNNKDKKKMEKVKQKERMALVDKMKNHEVSRGNNRMAVR